MSMLARVLTIKQVRECRSEQLMLARQRAMRDALRSHEQARAVLASWQAHSQAVEQGLYLDLCLCVVQRRDLEDVHQQVAALRQRTSDLQAAQEHADAAEQQAVQAWQQARLAHLEASRRAAAFQQAVQEEALLHRREAERAEDAQAEDLPFPASGLAVSAEVSA